MSSVPSTNEIPETRCNVCDAATNMRCSRCSSVHYCSREHSVQDWKKHKPNCVTPRVASKAKTSSSKPSFTATPSQPSKGSFQAIMLAANEDTPRMITMEYKWTDDFDGRNRPIKVQTLQQRHHFAKFAHPKEYFVKNVGIKGAKLPSDRCLVILYNDLILSDGDTPVNRCVKSLTNGKAPHAWADNLIVLRQRPMDRYWYYASANLEEDIGVLRRFFEEYWA
ncbi:uncharacterized protein SCHCODRAFT_01105628 [Schizophyllum commune H4-8]|uniref:uncharacterized protein n=1 Tax=Schizophyllum commune (strain H4-8 / FGSC 9210) TaxID=578458 RepID=UPI00215EBC1D|nr:uncharacterized protein SCHCODRAFT_01105628 [Schizophyllum commune H4-8]KAI5887191.1 hypothetical protein SCHCODRAFT_01105628 [Schizophyllum commune H4-8]